MAGQAQGEEAEKPMYECGYEVMNSDRRIRVNRVDKQISERFPNVYF